MENSSVYIYGGGTINKVRPHLSLSAPAFGSTARLLSERMRINGIKNKLILTKMADNESNIVSNDDLEKHIQDNVENNKDLELLFMNAAVTDFDMKVFKGFMEVDKDTRLSSKEIYEAQLKPAPKIIENIRKLRKDVFLVGWKMTNGASQQEQYLKALELCKRSHVNLVVANDVETGFNMVITPEEAAYHQMYVKNKEDRIIFLERLMKMALTRKGGTYRRTKHTAYTGGCNVYWKEVPQALQTVVNWLVDHGAYKPLPFSGVTVGHFGYRDNLGIYSSIRGSNFNNIKTSGLVKINIKDDIVECDSYKKPSAGGQTQKEIYEKYHEFDCIVHFHCELRPDTKRQIPVADQYPYECGSQECALNTVNNMGLFNECAAVHLNNHGPNIAFSSETDPQIIIDFIKESWDLTKKTGGFQI